MKKELKKKEEVLLKLSEYKSDVVSTLDESIKKLEEVKKIGALSSFYQSIKSLSLLFSNLKKYLSEVTEYSKKYTLMVPFFDASFTNNDLDELNTKKDLMNETLSSIIHMMKYTKDSFESYINSIKIEHVLFDEEVKSVITLLSIINDITESISQFLWYFKERNTIN